MNYLLKIAFNFPSTIHFIKLMYKQYFQVFTSYQLDLLFHLSLFSFVFVITPLFHFIKELYMKVFLLNFLSHLLVVLNRNYELMHLYFKSLIT